MSELAIGLSIVAILISGFALLSLFRLMRAMEDLNTSLSNTVDKISDIENRLQTSQRQLATLTDRPKTSLNIVELIPAILQKNGNGQWVPVAIMGFRAFEAYFKKRRSRRNALNKGDVGNVNRENADQIEGQVL